MNVLRSTSIVASVLLHSALALAFVDLKSAGNALQAGTGDDQFRIEQGLAIEGVARFGDAPETIEARDAETVEASQAVTAMQEIKAVEAPSEPPPPEDVPTTTEPPELKDVVTSPLGPPQEIVTVMQVPPPQVQPQPEQQQSEYQPEQVAVIEQEAASKSQTGGDVTVYNAYRGSIRSHIERFKLRPRKIANGEVIVKVSIDRDGMVVSREVQSSSGSQELDHLALSAIDKAVPFPKIPVALNSKTFDVSIPFHFVTR